MEAGSLDRRHCLARASRMAGMSGQVRSQLLSSPEFKLVLGLVKRDKAVAKVVVELAESSAESSWERGRSSVPGSFEDINDEAYGSLLLTDYARVSGPLEKALEAFLALGKRLDARADEEDIYEVLDQPLQMMLDRGVLGDWEGAYESFIEEAQDAAAERRDPYGYRGLSRSDFYATVSRVAGRRLS